jgi:hypothetical protein
MGCSSVGQAAQQQHTPAAVVHKQQAELSPVVAVDSTGSHNSEHQQQQESSC